MLRRIHRAFTLVELLVVIAIIAVLIAILLPVLGKARQQAFVATCAENMKGLGQAVVAYAGVYGFYPPFEDCNEIATYAAQGAKARHGANGGGAGGPWTADNLIGVDIYGQSCPSWSQLIFPYAYSNNLYNSVGGSIWNLNLGSKNLFTCPAVTVNSIPSGQSSQTYGYNAWLGGCDMSVEYPPSSYWHNPSPPRFGAAHHPSNLMMFCDQNYVDNLGDGNGISSANLIYPLATGEDTLVTLPPPGPPGQAPTGSTAPQWSMNPPDAYPFGNVSAYPGSTNMPANAVQTPVHQVQGGFSFTGDTTPGQRSKGYINVCFADGHVEELYLDQTKLTSANPSTGGTSAADPYFNIIPGVLASPYIP